jgi:hypothetical protein
VTTVVSTEDELFVGTGSTFVELSMVAVLVRTVPPGVPAGTWTTSWKVADPSTGKKTRGSLAVLHTTLPLPPRDGVEQTKSTGAVSVLRDTNVVPSGSVSVQTTFATSKGPLLLTVMR